MSLHRLFWTAIAFAALAFAVCARYYAPNIELQLQNQGEQVLRTAGLSEVELQVDGRFATLTGSVVSENDRLRAGELLAQIWGLLPVNNLLQVRAGAASDQPAAETPPDPVVSIAEVQTRLDALLDGQTVEFEVSSARLATAGKALLDRVAAVLAAANSVNVDIEGHTDDIGDPNYNQSLSEQRAQAVLSYLVGKGIAADRLTAAGFGPSQPIADNKTRQGRQQNRRVVFRAR